MSNSTTNDSAGTWFGVLRAARTSGDRELEAMARRELERMGIRVTIRKGQKPKGGAQ